MSAEDKIKNESRYSIHIESKKEARRLVKCDKQQALTDLTLCCANYDLQKILTTPKSDVSVMYYMSKLNVWNFTIYQMGVSKGSCFVWNETIGNRGSNEIASYVQSFLYQQAEKGVDKFRFYTDNCSGQNRNKNVFSMYVKVSNELKVEIIHR